MTVTSGYQSVPMVMTNTTEHARQIAQATNNILKGKINTSLDVTLNPSATTTVISDPRIGSSTAIIPAMATTASAATAIASGIHISNVTPPVGSSLGSATINHASNAATDQTIRFSLIG